MNLFITGAWQSAKDYISDIERLGHKVVFMQQEKERILCDYTWIEGVICNGLFLYHDIELFQNLRFIQLTSAGYDRVPMNYIQQHGIDIYNARGVYSIPMAEFAVSGVLQIYKKSRFFYENQKKHKWEKHRQLIELAGKQVCIIGCGSVGTECAKRFRVFGCEIIGVDLLSRNDVHYDQVFGIDKLQLVLPNVDIVVLTLPLTEKTKYLMNDEMFNNIKEGAILVNIARGAIVDRNALIDHIGRLGGAVLDVFEEEPLCADSPLWSMSNVIITPHNSFVGDGNKDRLDKVIIKNLEYA